MLPDWKAPDLTDGPSLANSPAADSYLRIKQNIDKLRQSITAIAGSMGPRALTAEQLAQIAADLQMNGSNPLNITALPGVALQPQLANIPAVTVLPAPATSQDGQLVLYRHVIWRFQALEWSPVSTIVIIDTQENLANYNPANYAPGVIFISSNSGTGYVEQDVNVSGTITPTWVPLFSPTLVLVHADRRSSGTLDTAGNNNNYVGTWASGEHFRQTMVGQRIWIAGNLYGVASFANNNSIGLSGNVGNLSGAAYVFEYASVNYPLGELLYESDRTVFYYGGNANGAVSVSGNNVGLVSGFPFDPYWRTISLNNTSYNIASVTSNNALVLAAGPANGSYNYQVERGAWIYATGTMVGNNNQQPTDLNGFTDDKFYFWNENWTIMRQVVNVAGVATFRYRWGTYTAAFAQIPSLNANDLNLPFEASDYQHTWRWNGNNYEFAGDSGSGYIVAGVAAPLGGLWAACDGSNATVAQANGTTATITTPDLRGDIFIRGGNYTGNRQNATSANWAPGAKTEDEATHNHATGANNVAVTIGGPDVASFVPGTTGPGSPHNHSLSNNAALLAPSDTNGGVPLRINLTWWMRR